MRRSATVAAAVLSCVAGAAHGAVTISSAATKDMTCSAGVCAPTARKAVLNANDLETLLATGSVTVTTTGSGVQAGDIDVKDPFGWTTSTTLGLDAYNSIEIDRAVSVGGTGGLSLATNDGGSGGQLSFGQKGSVVFQNLSGALSVNGVSYTLVDTLPALAGAIAADPAGAYALAASYNAGKDGTYGQSPIPTTFTGSFEGLGNAISNLSIDDLSKGNVPEGLFLDIATGASVRDFRLVAADVEVRHLAFDLGALAAVNYGTITDSSSSGTVAGAHNWKNNSNAELGGLVGTNFGTIEFSRSSAELRSVGAENMGGLVGANIGTVLSSHASGKVRGQSCQCGGLIGENIGSVSQSSAAGNVEGGFAAGGLVGYNYGPGEYSGTIGQSYASGSVTGGHAGGLTGFNNGILKQSYSTGNVSGITDSYTGGLIGLDVGSVTQAYSTGAVTAGSGSDIGGFVGYDGSNAGISYAYWDTTTSGITNLSQGAGNIANDPGITGLSNKQFRAGLPSGFDPAVWARDKKINNGLPYLIANPPPKQ